LDKHGEAVPCGEKAHTPWWLRNGQSELASIKADRIGTVLVETCFNSISREQDGPHLFWEVRISSPPDYVNNKGSLLGALKADLNRIFAPDISNNLDALEAAIRESAQFKCERRFGTREAALEFHAQVRKRVRRQHALCQQKSDLVQEFLANVSAWCAQKHGRQTKLARQLGVKPQVVNDYLNGREKITAEHALKLQQLVTTPGKSPRRVKSPNLSASGKNPRRPQSVSIQWTTLRALGYCPITLKPKLT
jgi:hypothetical protein